MEGMAGGFHAFASFEMWSPHFLEQEPVIFFNLHFKGFSHKNSKCNVGAERKKALGTVIGGQRF